MIDIGYFYLVPLVVGIMYLIVTMLLNQPIKREKPFENPYFNTLYNLSYAIPFKWFVEENPRHDKAVSMNKLIKEAKKDHTMDYRSSTVLQVCLIIGGLVVFFLVNLSLSPIISLFGVLLNLNTTQLLNDPSTLLTVRMVVFIISILPALGIKLWLKQQIKRNEIAFLKDLPLLQLFIVLMLRSNATVDNVLYTLSNTETAYKMTFASAYRIYLREPTAGFDYLEDVFHGTKIIETIYTLRDFSEYAKDESIRTMENNQEEILNFTATARKKAEAGKNIWASISFAFPFVAIIILAGGPLVFYAMELFNSAGL